MARWDAYVETNPRAHRYHRSAWRRIIESSFGHRAHYLMAEAIDGRPTGVLPLVRVRSRMFGDFLVSLPFVNYGGPCADDPETAHRLVEEAVRLARGLLEELDVVGVLCVEFFVTRDGRLLVNELAPRPHNSGHLTFDASVTSQFEQQLRAVCGLPLGSTELLRPAAMANLLGDLWSGGEPDWAAACAFPDVKLHLYGKSHARPGRKMGHLTALAERTATARERVLHARMSLVES
jgi:hypothetical protein